MRIVYPHQTDISSGHHLTANFILQASYDLLFGCDGIHSHTRRLVFGDDEQFEHFMGYQFAIFEIPPLPHDLHNSFHMHVQPNRQVAVYPTQGDKWLVFVTFKSETESIPAQGERIPALKNLLSDMDWYVPEIFDTVDEDAYVFWDNLMQIHMPQWYQGRVALIGDSAYCPSLVSGQGASMAMAGAYFLAEALKETSNHTLAFQKMNAQLHPHIEKIQQSAQDFASTFVPKSWLRIQLVNWVLRFSNIPMFQGIIGKQFTVNSILD